MDSNPPRPPRQCAPRRVASRPVAAGFSDSLGRLADWSRPSRIGRFADRPRLDVRVQQGRTYNRLAEQRSICHVIQEEIRDCRRAPQARPPLLHAHCAERKPSRESSRRRVRARERKAWRYRPWRDRRTPAIRAYLHSAHKQSRISYPFTWQVSLCWRTE